MGPSTCGSPVTAHHGAPSLLAFLLLGRLRSLDRNSDEETEILKEWMVDGRSVLELSRKEDSGV